MGLFSDSYKTYVDSVVYNLAGDVPDRLNFLRSSVARNVLSPGSRRRSFADSFTTDILNGPFLDQARFFRWCRNAYPDFVPQAEVTGFTPTSNAAIEAELPDPGAGFTVELVSAHLERANFFLWAERHILATRPVDIDTNWTADLITNDTEVLITYEDTSTETIPLTDYISGARYMYVNYDIIETATSNRELTLYIYRIGSGNSVLDTMATETTIAQEFYPFLPLRLNNVSIRDPIHAALFEDCKKIYRRGYRGDINEIIDKLEDNESIADIDFAYLVFGVPLNTQDNEARHYIYEFFKLLQVYQSWGITTFNAWNADRIANSNSAPEPVLSSIHLDSPIPALNNYDMQLTWVTIDEVTGTGLGKPGAEVGEFWFEVQPALTYRRRVIWFNVTSALPYVRFYHQISATAWRRLDIYGMVYRNFVYKSKDISISTTEALADPEESGFLVPMHYPTLKSISTLKATQASVHNSLIVFNVYKTVKTRWYQKGFFRIVFTVVLIGVSAIFFPGGIGILGSNLAVGASLGLSGTTALVVGAIANATAAMLLTAVVQLGAVAIFGEDLGLLIGAIASFIAIQYVSNFFVTGSFDLNWGELLKIDNLMKLTDSIMSNIDQWAQGKFERIEGEMVRVESDYQEKLREIENRTLELLGYSGTFIDPLMFTQAPDNSAYTVANPTAESSDTFLARTLMTGSDLADLSFAMISDFPTISKTLPKAV